MNTKIDGGLPPAAKAMEMAATKPAGVRSGEDRSEPVGAAPPVDSLRLTGEASGLQALQRELSASADIDVVKVNQVRAAIADGSYKVDPQQIATRMLALESELGR